jgi:hypothetical protein
MPPFSVSYDYLSDSDLEDASDCLSSKAKPHDSKAVVLSRRVKKSSLKSNDFSEQTEVTEDLRVPIPGRLMTSDSGGSGANTPVLRTRLGR